MPSIIADVFPATVALAQADFEVPIEELTSAPPTPGTIQINTSRVVLSQTRIVIGKDAPGGPQIVFSEEIVPGSYHKSPHSRDSFVTTVSGKKIAFRKDSSCGCGSRLRSWRPFGNTGSVKDPTE